MARPTKDAHVVPLNKPIKEQTSKNRQKENSNSGPAGKRENDHDTACMSTCTVLIIFPCHRYKAVGRSYSWFHPKVQLNNLYVPTTNSLSLSCPFQSD